MRGNTIQCFRESLHRRGWLRLDETTDYSILCSKLALNTSFVLHLHSIAEPASSVESPCSIAEFIVNDFPYVLNHGEKMTFHQGRFRLQITLDKHDHKNHRATTACLDGEQIPMQDAYILLASFLFFPGNSI